MPTLESDSGRDPPQPEQEQLQSSVPVSSWPPRPNAPQSSWRARPSAAALVALAASAALVLTWGYLFWSVGLPRAQGSPAARGAVETAGQAARRNEPLSPTGLPESYELPVSYGDLGPALLEAGAIDRAAFLQVYENAQRPLTQEQLRILDEGSDAGIVIDRSNAYFLLNFFWALGLANQNPVLDDGPMSEQGKGNIGRFASTGGWTIGAKDVTELYSSASILELTAVQQERLEEVAAGVYRPCCDNATLFPDCNHGMAMLGLLELMAARDASVEEMFEAAQYANAFWYPGQTLELATYFEEKRGLTFAEIEARELVSSEYSSASGFGRIHQWLATNGLLEQPPGDGQSCGV